MEKKSKFDLYVLFILLMIELVQMEHNYIVYHSRLSLWTRGAGQMDPSRYFSELFVKSFRNFALFFPDIFPKI